LSVSALFTDFYELTMMQGFYLSKKNPDVVFDMFYRTNPFEGGYAVFTGLGDLLKQLDGLTFSQDDIDYLRSLNKFDPRFLEYLGTYRFNGDVYSMEEGSIVFPNEPLIRVHTKLLDAQLIEGLLLNTINFQTLIATKSCRVANASGDSIVMEFGLRRAQGENGAMAATRAAFIGGCNNTSNTLAGRKFNIPVSGTMAHSWVMSFDNELDSFREFAHYYPDNCILLIDTYDTLGSGIENAIIVGLEQKSKGKKIGVRIDSGDLSYLSKIIRQKLDDADLKDAIICVSNDLTEEIIYALVKDNAPIDSWGVGTHLVTGGTQSSLNGVYKLCAKADENGKIIPVMKISNSMGKITNPGIKQVYRFYDNEGQALSDLICLTDEKLKVGKDYMFFHPISEADFFKMKSDKYSRIEPMLFKVMEKGHRIDKMETLQELQQKVKDNLTHFHKSYKRFINPHIYKVSLSSKLSSMKLRLIKEIKLK